ncbi:MAG: S8 family peptidase [Trueperaceae bacterium]
MNNIVKQLLALSTVMVLAACSTPAPVLPPSTDIASVATVTVPETATEAGLAAQYGAQIISFKPEAGFAVLGFSVGEITTLSTTKNQDFFSSPEMQASGNKAWGAGKSAWSGGMKAWSNGKTTWSAGNMALSAPSENKTVWEQINLNEAHKNSRLLGESMKVAVLDTGIDLQHEIFQGSLAPSSEWKDFVDNDANPQEGGSSTDAGYGHGTAVAGIILQVAPKATILPIRVLAPDGSGDLDDVVAAIEWAVDKGANIINLSLGSAENTNALTKMVEYAASKQVLIVASVGNDGEAEGVTYPASLGRKEGKIDTLFGKVYSVASVNAYNIVSLFSNYSTNMSGVAPGENIATAFPGNQLVYATGTSFATPLYSGALALALADNPTMSRLVLHIMFQNASSKRSWDLNLWPKNFNQRGLWSIGKGVIDVAGVVAGARYGSGNLVGNPNMSEGLTYWTNVVNAVITEKEGSGDVVLINGAGYLEQTLWGLRPNSSYTLGLEFFLSNPRDTLIVRYLVNGVWTEQRFQGAWTKPTLTFTTAADQRTATIRISKESTTDTAMIDNISLIKQ